MYSKEEKSFNISYISLSSVMACNKEIGPNFIREIVSVTSNKKNYSTSCENESINNFQLSTNVDLGIK